MFPEFTNMLGFFVVLYIIGNGVVTVFGAFEKTDEDRHNTTQAKIEVVGVGVFILLGRVIFNWW